MKKGAFTGATARKKGRIELANKGTLFLDEIGEMSLELQSKLLRVLQEKQIQRIGGLETIDVDFRLIAATNRTLSDEVEKRNFRSDLYYRLNIINIDVPPLRSRTEDIPLLAANFIKRISDKNSLPEKTISPSLMEKMLLYRWPGNVRELENCIERLMVISQGDTLDEYFFNPETEDNSNNEIKSRANNVAESYDLFEIEKKVLLEVLEKVQWNKSKAARMLNIDRKALYNRIKKYRIGE